MCTEMMFQRITYAELIKKAITSRVAVTLAPTVFQIKEGSPAIDPMRKASLSFLPTAPPATSLLPSPLFLPPLSFPLP